MPPPRNSSSSYLPMFAGSSMAGLPGRRRDAAQTVEKILLEHGGGAAGIHQELIGERLAGHHDGALFPALLYHPLEQTSAAGGTVAVGIGEEAEERPQAIAVL